MPNSTIRTVLAGLAVAIIAAGCKSGPEPMSLEVPLNYNATDSLAGNVPVMEANPKLKLFVEVKDDRADTSKIGQNLEEDKLGPRPITGTGQAPPEFVAMILNRNLPTVGVNVTPERSQANRVLTLTLTQFFVTETGSYKAMVGGGATLTDGAGAPLWTGTVNADNSTFGRSMSAENYTQVLSNASLELAENLLKTPAFVQALKVP